MAGNGMTMRCVMVALAVALRSVNPQRVKAYMLPNPWSLWELLDASSLGWKNTVCATAEFLHSIGRKQLGGLKHENFTIVTFEKLHEERWSILFHQFRNDDEPETGAESDDADSTLASAPEVNLKLSTLVALHTLGENADQSDYAVNGRDPTRITAALKSPPCECGCRLPKNILKQICDSFWTLPKASQDAMLWSLQSEKGPSRRTWSIEGPHHQWRLVFPQTVFPIDWWLSALNPVWEDVSILWSFFFNGHQSNPRLSNIFQAYEIHLISTTIVCTPLICRWTHQCMFFNASQQQS